MIELFMQNIIILGLTLGLLISNSASIWSNDLEEAERVYFDHRVNFFDMTLITNNYLCSIAIKNNAPNWETGDIYKTYIREALLRGLSQKECAQLTGRYID